MGRFVSQQVCAQSMQARMQQEAISTAEGACVCREGSVSLGQPRHDVSKLPHMHCNYCSHHVSYCSAHDILWQYRLKAQPVGPTHCQALLHCGVLLGRHIKTSEKNVRGLDMEARQEECADTHHSRNAIPDMVSECLTKLAASATAAAQLSMP